MSFSIKDLEALSGIKSHTIRIWEQRYQLFTPLRTQTNIRQYSVEDLKKFLIVSHLYASGKKISSIGALIKEYKKAEAFNATDEDEISRHILFSLIDNEWNLLNKLIDHAVTVLGSDATIKILFLLVLPKAQIVWTTKNYTSTHLKAASHIIRNKILFLTIKLPIASDTPLQYILFLPENEFYELDLLCINYFLKKKNVQVTYLGANLPFQDVEYVIQKISPTHVLFQSLTVKRVSQKQISNLVVKHPAVNFLHWTKYHLSKKSSPSTLVLSSSKEVFSYISNTI